MDNNEFQDFLKSKPRMPGLEKLFSKLTPNHIEIISEYINSTQGKSAEFITKLLNDDVPYEPPLLSLFAHASILADIIYIMSIFVVPLTLETNKCNSVHEYRKKLIEFVNGIIVQNLQSYFILEHEIRQKMHETMEEAKTSVKH